jgi:hypothetical protein
MKWNEWNGMERNEIASGSVAEWNRERQRGGMESRAAVWRNGGIPQKYYI